MDRKVALFRAIGKSEKKTDVDKGFPRFGPSTG